MVDFLGANFSPEGKGRLFFETMEESLEQNILNRRGLHFHHQQIRSVAWRLLKGLVDINKTRVIHGNLHTGNMMLDNVGLVKIADLGACWKLGAKSSRRRGHPKVAPPEFQRPYTVSYESDLFALAICLLEMALLEIFSDRRITSAQINEMLDRAKMGKDFDRLIKKLTGPASKRPRNS